MVVRQIFRSSVFEKEFKRQDNSLKQEIRKKMQKIYENPEIGKPLRHNLKGEREVYVRQFRLIYLYQSEELTFLKFRHKDEAGEN